MKWQIFNEIAKHAVNVREMYVKFYFPKPLNTLKKQLFKSKKLKKTTFLSNFE